MKEKGTDHPATAARRRWRAALAPVGTLLIFATALWVMNRLLADYHYSDIQRAVTSIRPSLLAASLAATVAGYLALVGYDYVAFRIIGKPLPLSTMLVPSFVSFAVSNSAPASVVTAGGVRYRLYAERGLTTLEAAAVAGINVVTYALGLCALAGLVLLVRPIAPGSVSSWLTLSAHSLGVILLVAVAAYFAAILAKRESITMLGHRMPLPTTRLALAQLGVSVADWILSSGALYVLLASFDGVDFLGFLVRFLVGQFAALLAPIPGGLGVFEAVVLYFTSTGAPAPRVLAALVVYRVIYYLLPLVVAGLLLLVRAARRAAREGRGRGAWVLDVVSSAAPHVMSFVTFVAGALLLLTGTIPANARRLLWLGRILPLPLIEVSHFLSSVLGAVLLIVAWGLESRVRAAYRIARGLFAFGIVLTLLRSFDVRLAEGLGFAFVVLVVASRAFPASDHESLLRDTLSPGWVFAIGAALIVTLSVGAFAYHGVYYSNELWWRFTLNDGDAPRSLRAVVGASIAVLLFVFARYLARRAPPPLGEAPEQ